MSIHFGASSWRAVIADELVARARQTNADVTFVEDAARLAAYGGVGAKLRFRF